MTDDIKERCDGCAMSRDYACGRTDCPKHWPVGPKRFMNLPDDDSRKVENGDFVQRATRLDWQIKYAIKELTELKAALAELIESAKAAATPTPERLPAAAYVVCYLHGDVAAYGRIPDMAVFGNVADAVHYAIEAYLADESVESQEKFKKPAFGYDPDDGQSATMHLVELRDGRFRDLVFIVREPVQSAASDATGSAS